MEFLKITLVIALFAATSAKPMGWRRHHDADISDKDWVRGLLDGHNRWFLLSNSDSSSSEESSESEEVKVTEPPLIMTTAVVPVISTGEGSTLPPEPETPGTNVPVIETTALPPTMTVPVDVTSPCNVTECVTVEIMTAVPITDNRGDN